MTKYCTVDDVIELAPTFKKDVLPLVSEGTAVRAQNTNTIPRDKITITIEEASEMVRSLLHPRYDTDVIDGLSPFPPVVVYYTKTYAAMLLYEREPGSGEYSEKRVGLLQRSLEEYGVIIANGELRDENNVLVPVVWVTSMLPGYQNDEFKANGNLRDLQRLNNGLPVY